MPKGVYERKRIPWEVRFLAKVDQRADDECWPWLGAVMHNGYGRFGMAAGDVRFAHRVAYEYWVGPIPEDMQIDHVKARGCTRRDCCNPAHLEPVVQRENLIRGNGWAGQARKTECDHGHSLKDALIHHGRRECRECNRLRCARRSRSLRETA